MNSPLSGFAKQLVNKALIDETTALQIQHQAQTKQLSLHQILLEKKLITPLVLATITAQEFGLPLLDLDAIDKTALPSTFIDNKLIDKHQALPLFVHDEYLYIALADPSNISALAEFSFHTDFKVQAVLVEADKLKRLIADKIHTSSQLKDISVFDTLNFSLEIETPEEIDSTEINDAPIVRFVQQILLDSIKKGVSDIHFEPFETHYRIRFRKDGLLYEAANPALNLASRISARIKILAQMNIAERRLPQDGHFKLALSHQHQIHFRVNSCPTTYGEKIVVRVLDPTKLQLGIQELGYEAFQQDLILKELTKPQGMFLVTGPTGSGKTVSLYTALAELNKPDINITTIEDPIEIQIPGINQVQASAKIGLNFATALRAFLRQDPDVIMVGEIRDLETAEIAIKAAQTGHLVLSTLHTNSAPETLTRLLSMGIAPYHIASSINVIIAQRLARKLCAHCKIALTLPKTALYAEGLIEEDEPGDLPLFAAHPSGCPHCQQGYQGRTGIYEILEITPEIGQLIMSGGNALDITTLALTQGMQSLRHSGLLKVKQGITSLDEINRIIKEA